MPMRKRSESGTKACMSLVHLFRSSAYDLVVSTHHLHPRIHSFQSNWEAVRWTETTVTSLPHRNFVSFHPVCVRRRLEMPCCRGSSKYDNQRSFVAEEVSNLWQPIPMQRSTIRRRRQRRRHSSAHSMYNCTRTTRSCSLILTRVLLPVEIRRT